MSQPPSGEDQGTTGAAGTPILPVRIVQVFTSPGTLFEALKQRPVWIDALLVLIGIGLATQLLIPDDIRRALIESSMESFMPAGTDPAVMQEQIDAAVNQPPIQGVLFSVVLTPALIALIAGLLMLAFNVVMGGEGKFKQLFSASVHAFYIYALGGMVVLGLMFMGSEQMVLSPGLFLPDSAEGFLARFLNGINVFSVWTCVVLGVAVSRIYPKRSVAAGAGYLLGLYLLLVAGMSALAGLAG